MRVTSNDSFVIEVPAVAGGVSSGQATIDLGALQAEAEAAQATADTALAVTDTLPVAQVTWVRTAADLPAAVAGVRTLADDHMYIPVGNINIGTNRLVVPDHCTVRGIGAFQSSISCANAGALISGRRLLIQDVALVNAAGPCVRVQGTVPADPNASLRAMGSAFVGASASGVVQAEDVDTVVAAECTWRGCTGDGLRVTGSVRAASVSQSLFRGNATGFRGMVIPASAVVVDRVLVQACGFDLASGGTGLDVDASALQPDGLHLEINVFPNADTPGVGTPLVGATADSPQCHFAGNINMENTHARGALSIADNAVATTVTDTTSFFPLAGTTTLVVGVGFDSPAAGKVRWTSVGPVRARAMAFVTLATGSPNQDLQIAFGLTPDGGPTTLLPARQEDITDGTSLRTGGMSMLDWPTLQPGDVLDLRVRNKSAANNVTWLHGQFAVEQVGA